MSQGSTSSPRHELQEKLVSVESMDQHSTDQAAIPSYWPEQAIPDSLPLAIPLAKQMTNIGLLLCPCPGFGWVPPDGYCPLPDASPAVYDPNQPYIPEKQPILHVPSVPVREGHHLSEAGQYNHLHCEEGAHHLAQPSYSNGEHVQLASPPDSAKDVFFPRDQPLVHYSDDFAPSDVRASNAISFNPDYMHTDEQHHDNRVGDFLNTIAPHSTGLSTTTRCSDVPQYGLIPARVMADQGPLVTWGDLSMPSQPTNFDILLPDQRGGKRGPFKDPKLREQTAQTRRTGSCIRCRMQRIRCESDPEDPGGVCLTCTNVANTKAGRFPCLRYKITDVKLYKPGQVPGYEWTRRWTNSITDPIQKWSSSEVKIIRVSAGFSDRCIELQVRKFIPQDGDKLARTWDYNGTKKSVAIPPYALIDLESTKLTYSSHIQDIMTDTIQRTLERPDSLLSRTYFRAVQLIRTSSTPADSTKLLRLTLTLWVSIRLSTTSSFLVGKETLGMPGDILDGTSPDAGKIPMPPVLGAQLDLVLIHHIQTKLRREMLEVLQKMVLKNKQMTWLVTYLVTFILLHNTALITAHDASYARKHGMKRRFAREDKVKEYHLGANILLAHFHYCNKGMYPFSSDCKDKELRTLADLNDDELQFVRMTRDYVRRHRQDWQRVRSSGAYEDDFFFVSQLFEENWKPLMTM
ncbi:hypothetical protein HIM_02354 [Hirsutella minnesotensis 3608]|nr:hypothetical protein HIM_02354 [Hirsutella minnesotensis 3608]